MAVSSFKFDISAPARGLPESFDYGVHAMRGALEIGTHEQRITFAQKMYRRAHNVMEYERVLRTIFKGDDAGLVQACSRDWPLHPDVLQEWERLDETKEEIDDGLPSKQKLARDIYNLASSESVDPDDRLKAFRLFGEIQGHVGRVGGVTNNIDNRSIILVPRRARDVDDPDREQKVIEAQARLVKDASVPK